MPKKIIISLSVIFILVASIAVAAYAVPKYRAYQLQRKISKVEPLLDHLLQHAVNYVKQNGFLPAADTLDFNALAMRETTPGSTPLLYRIKFWSSDLSQATSGLKQTAYLQAYLNGRALGLAPGYGGMVTCLLANGQVDVKSSCYYQVKEM